MYKLHIPTEQYGFCEVEMPQDTPPEALKFAYDTIKGAFSGNVDGIPQKEFNAEIDRYLTEHTLNADSYTNMSKAQQYVIQELKKSFKRINKED